MPFHRGMLDLPGRATPVSLLLPDSLSEADWLEVGRRLNSVGRSVISIRACFMDRSPRHRLRRDADERHDAFERAYDGVFTALQWVRSAAETLRRLRDEQEGRD